MSKKAAQTGSGPTVVMAIEQLFGLEQRVLVDDYAYKMLPTAMRALVKGLKWFHLVDWMINSGEKGIPGVWAGMLIRKKYIDEKLIDYAKEVEGVVNLGAGFDTRSLRVPLPTDVKVWELDQPSIISEKRAIIQKEFSTMSNNVNLLSIDFDTQSIDEVLTKNGYSHTKKCFFVWEGVTQYLTKDGIVSTFEFLEKAASGSRVALTYVPRDFIEGRDLLGMEMAYKKYVTDEKMWIFGLNQEEWPEFLQRYGYRLIEDVGSDQLFDKYIAPTGRMLKTTPLERMLLAEKI